MAGSDFSKYAVATTGAAVKLLAGLFGFKKKKQSSKWLRHTEDRVDALDTLLLKLFKEDIWGWEKNSFNKMSSSCSFFVHFLEFWKKMIEIDKKSDDFWRWSIIVLVIAKEEKCLSLNETIHPRENEGKFVSFLGNLCTRARDVWITVRRLLMN